MEFLEGIKGIRIGGKLARVSGALAKDIVNHIHTTGARELLVGDTHKILVQSFCACWVLSLSKTRGSVLTTGAALEHALDILADWFLDVTETREKVDDIQRFKSAFVSDLKSASLAWNRELKSSHPELVGRSIDEWIPAIGSALATNVGFDHKDSEIRSLPRFIAERFAIAATELL